MILRRQFAAIFPVLAFLLLLGIYATPVTAAGDGAGAFVSRLGEKTIAKLTDVSLTPTGRKDEFRELLREGFAIKAIALFVLGKYRAETSDATAAEFVQTFEDYIVALYGKQFKPNKGQRFLVEKVVNTSRENDSMVMTRVYSGNGAEPLRVNFQVRRAGDGFKIVDVRVEGVSMVLAQREEFTSYIAANGGRVETLIRALRKRVEAGATTANK